MLTELEQELLKSVERLTRQYSVDNIGLQAALREFQTQLEASTQTERLITDQRIENLSNSLRELDGVIAKQQMKLLEILMQTQFRWQSTQAKRLDAMEGLCKDSAEQLRNLLHALIG